MICNNTDILRLTSQDMAPDLMGGKYLQLLSLQQANHSDKHRAGEECVEEMMIRKKISACTSIVPGAVCALYSYI